ncbi:MAG TPA: hypothetical protein VFV94_06610 [Polyangiaceae bacterium]|nr:hypothetical protein [Polyangiaceae bacterium]
MGSLRLGVRFAVTLGLAAGVAFGCAGRTTEPSGAELCPDLCARGKKCPAAPPISNCDDFCLGEDARATGTNCHDLYDKAENCLADLDDVCTGPRACANEINAANDCELAYCMKHPSDEVCASPVQ